MYFHAFLYDELIKAYYGVRHTSVGITKLPYTVRFYSLIILLFNVSHLVSSGCRRINILYLFINECDKKFCYSEGIWLVFTIFIFMQNKVQNETQVKINYSYLLITLGLVHMKYTVCT